MVCRLADRLTRSDPLQLRHLDGKTEFVCIPCGRRHVAAVLAAVEGDWTKLVDRRC